MATLTLRIEWKIKSTKNLENIAPFGQGHQWHETAIAPALDGDAFHVNDAVRRRHMLKPGHLILDFDLAQVALDLTLNIISCEKVLGVQEVQENTWKKMKR